MKSFLSSSNSKSTVQQRKIFDFPPKILYENRYCNQEDFSVLVCGGRTENNKVVKTVYKLDGRELKCNNFTSMPNELFDCQTVVINSELFVFGGYLQNNGFDGSVRKFCNKTQTWLHVTKLHFHKFACSCSFKNNLYVIRGNKMFFVYYLKNDKWTQLADTKQIRYYAACTVF